jgi:hypothetical protein
MVDATAPVSVGGGLDHGPDAAVAQ